MVTTCFGQYGHHWVLKCVVGKLLLFILLLLHVWPLRYARLSVTCVKISIRIFVCKVLYIMWLLLCVLTVLGVSCSFLFFVTCLILECLFAGLDWFFLL
jgi:hypothetical protein